MTAPTMNAAAITRRIRAAGHHVVSHRDPQRPGNVRVVPIVETHAGAVAAAGAVAELLRAAGYAVQPIQMSGAPGDALTVSLPEPAESDPVPTTTPRTVEDRRVTTDPAERAVLLAAAARLDALPTDDEPERTDTEWVVYCPTHRHYVAFAGVTGTTWTDEQDGARRYTKREAEQAATRATWRDHNPTRWPLPAADDEPASHEGAAAARLRADATARALSGHTTETSRAAAAELVTYRSTGGGAYELAEPAKPVDVDQLAHDLAWAERAVATAATDTDREDAERRVETARTALRAVDRPDLVPALLAARRTVELATPMPDRLRPLLDRYADAVANWQAANLASDDAPSVADSTAYSERLEELAHDLAYVARDLVPDYVAPVTVHMENSYACGHESESTHKVAPPADTTDEAIEAWWEETVQPLSGDGHDCGASEHALYEATVTGAPDLLTLVGETWSGEG